MSPDKGHLFIGIAQEFVLRRYVLLELGAGFPCKVRCDPPRHRIGLKARFDPRSVHNKQELVMLVRHRSLPLRFLNLRRVAALLGLVLLAAVSSTAFAQEYTDIRRLGTSNAVSKPGPSNGEELKAIFRQYRSDYEKVLADTNWPGNPQDLFNAVENDQFSEAQYPVGHTFEWMAVRKRGVV
jgi:hypothetical protein